jgi:hypothetical protein
MATQPAGLAWTQILSTLTGAPGGTGPVTCAVPLAAEQPVSEALLGGNIW